MLIVPKSGKSAVAERMLIIVISFKKLHGVSCYVQTCLLHVISTVLQKSSHYWNSRSLENYGRLLINFASETFSNNWIRE